MVLIRVQYSEITKQTKKETVHLTLSKSLTMILQ